MLKKVCIKEIYANPSVFEGVAVSVSGWARTIRDSKAFGFIELNDGSYFKTFKSFLSVKN